VTLKPDPNQSPAWARGVSGAEVALTALPAGGGVTGGPLPEPGPYLVVDAKGATLEKLGFAAAIDAGASNLARHGLDALSEWLGEESVRTAGSGGPANATPLWTWLIMLAVIAFFFEGVLLRK
jgi:hypothetical protein